MELGENGGLAVEEDTDRVATGNSRPPLRPQKVSCDGVRSSRSVSPRERVGGSDHNCDQHRSARQRQTAAQPVWEIRLAAREAGWPRYRFTPLAPAGRIQTCNDSRTSRRCPPHEDHQFIVLNVIDDSVVPTRIRNSPQPHLQPLYRPINTLDVLLAPDGLGT